MKRFRYCINCIYSSFSPDRVFSYVYDSEWLTLAQSCQHCLTQHAKLQAQAQTHAQAPVADRTELNPSTQPFIEPPIKVSEWTNFQALVQTEFLFRVMPVLDRDPQFRSLVPEVVRLMKLLQMDWQFWQAARQAPKRAIRQQQFVDHLTQLGQLLSVLQTLLENRAGLKKCPD